MGEVSHTEIYGRTGPFLTNFDGHSLEGWSASAMSAHEKLQVYGKALDFVAKTAVWTNSWDRRHAFVDHLSRAAESIALNLAEAARQRGAPGRLQILDFAVGSSLECAGCFDIAQIKQLLTAHQCYDEKLRLCEI